MRSFLNVSISSDVEKSTERKKTGEEEEQFLFHKDFKLTSITFGHDENRRDDLRIVHSILFTSHRNVHVNGETIQ